NTRQLIQLLNRARDNAVESGQAVTLLIDPLRSRIGMRERGDSEITWTRLTDGARFETPSTFHALPPMDGEGSAGKSEVGGMLADGLRGAGMQSGGDSTVLMTINPTGRALGEAQLFLVARDGRAVVYRAIIVHPEYEGAQLWALKGSEWRRLR